MNRKNRILSESKASLKSFFRKKTTVFFTFFFPLLIIGLSSIFIYTGGSGFLKQKQAFYIAGYLSVVVLLTPIQRIASEVTRYRNSKRFEKLQTTPLTRSEWLLSHFLVNLLVVFISSIIILSTLSILDHKLYFSFLIFLFIIFGVIAFCGIGAILGSVIGSQDGVTAASNAVGLPMLFLADTFITQEMLPSFIRPIVNVLPLTYFARGVRSIIYSASQIYWINLLILTIFAIISFSLGIILLKQT